MTSISIWDNIRLLIEVKREEIYQRYGRKVTQMDVASAAIIRGLKDVEDELGLNKVDKER